MATDYKIVVVPDTGGTRPCIKCPQCLGLQLLCTVLVIKIIYILSLSSPNNIVLWARLHGLIISCRTTMLSSTIFYKAI